MTSTMLKVLYATREVISSRLRTIRYCAADHQQLFCKSGRSNELRLIWSPVSRVTLCVLILGLSFVVGAIPLFGSVTGSISGTVKDASGAVIPGVSVELRNTQTGVAQTIKTDSAGFYNFPALDIGHYDITFRKSGFQEYDENGLVIEVDSLLRVDAVMQIGGVNQAVTVTATAAQVNTQNAQMGELVGGSTIVGMPLNGRSYTDLLALQPGVVPVSSGEYGSGFAPSGDLDTGSLSISGNRENFNGYMVNGALVEEGMFDTPSVVPNLDSIAEFRILTNNTDAEYGNFSGGLVNVATKSGTNQFHGDLFEFLRNTSLDARNYFSPSRGVYHQNQFGGTFGGPILHNKMFFFGDYQGTRQSIGVDTGNIPVPSSADRTGNLSDSSSSLTGTVNGQFWANTLSSRLGYTVTVGEPYYTANCVSSADCVFPNAVIPQTAWAAPASYLLPYIPLSNVPGGFFSTSANSQPLQDDKGAIRVDGNSRWGALSAYYLDDQYNTTNPYGGGNLPGFSAVTKGSAQLVALGDTTTFASSAVNQFNLSFVRDVNYFAMAVGGLGTTPASLGFAAPADGGIYPSAPGLVGVPTIALNNYSFGVSPFPLNQFDNTYQVQDGFTKIIGANSIKFGVDFHYDQINFRSTFAYSNGAYYIGGTETGLDFADLLLGAPSAYYQGVPGSLDMRARYAGLYAQDSWRATSNLTVNVGIRWEVIPYWADTKDRTPTFVEGEQSQKFPGAPLGYVFPGDPGVSATIAPTRYGNFAPRIGLAYAPNPSGGLLRRFLGDSGKSSIRAGYGIYYTAIEGQSNSTTAGTAAPYGIYYVSPASPLLAQPFITRASGQNLGQRFPIPLPPTNVSIKNPDTNVNWAQFYPISSVPAIDPNDVNPNVQSIDFSFERQLGANTVLSLSYVGTLGHHLVSDLDNNSGVPSACLAVSNLSQVLPGTPTCSQFGENGVYYPASGGIVNGTRAPFGPLFGGNGFYSTIGNSNYNAFEASLHHTSGRLQFLAGYTYSKSLDDSSGYGDQVYPYNPRLSYALSAFDMTDNFVFSYTYELPFDKLLKADNRLTRGWKLSGITRFSTGLPVTLSENDDNSLLGSCDTGPNGSCVDLPNFTAGNILNNTNPRSGEVYFNTSLFSPEQLGQFGNARRRFFHGPGIDNWDMALLKDLRLTESKSLEFRGEFFNAFNHTQFYGAGAVDGNINSGAFGLVTSAAAPRIGQVALKFLF